MMRKLTSILLLILLTALVSFSQSTGGGKNKPTSVKTEKRATVPVNLKNAEEDAGFVEESSFVVTVSNKNEILVGGDTKPVPNIEFTKRLKNFGRNLSPDRRYVYIKADPEIDYKVLADLIYRIRLADFDKLKLVVSRTDKPIANAAFDVTLNRFNDYIVAPYRTKPNPNTLIVFMDKDGSLRLNREEQTFDSLKSILLQVFRSREKNGVLRDGTNETEKMVLIKPSRKVKYGEVAKIIDALKEVGAYPIGLQIDDLVD